MNEFVGVTYGTMGKGLHNRSRGDPKAAVTLNSPTQRGWGLTKEASLEPSAQHARNYHQAPSFIESEQEAWFSLHSHTQKTAPLSGYSSTRLGGGFSNAAEALRFVLQAVQIAAAYGTNMASSTFFLLVLKVCIQSNRFHYGFSQRTLFLSPFLTPSISPAASSFWPTVFLQTMHFSPSHTFRAPPLFTENMQYLSFFCKNIYLLDVCIV